MALNELTHEFFADAVGVEIRRVNEISTCLAVSLIDLLRFSLWFGGGRTCRVAMACPLFGHEGSRQDVYAGVVQRGRESRHYGQQRPARADRHGIESGRWRLGCTAEGRHSARPLRAC
jgi:hypothetical protein